MGSAAPGHRTTPALAAAEVDAGGRQPSGSRDHVAPPPPGEIAATGASVARPDCRRAQDLARLAERPDTGRPRGPVTPAVARASQVLRWSLAGGPGTSTPARSSSWGTAPASRPFTCLPASPPAGAASCSTGARPAPHAASPISQRIRLRGHGRWSRPVPLARGATDQPPEGFRPTPTAIACQAGSSPSPAVGEPDLILLDEPVANSFDDARWRVRLVAPTATGAPRPWGPARRRSTCSRRSTSSPSSATAGSSRSSRRRASSVASRSGSGSAPGRTWTRSGCAPCRASCGSGPRASGSGSTAPRTAPWRSSTSRALDRSPPHPRRRPDEPGRSSSPPSGGAR